MSTNADKFLSAFISIEMFLKETLNYPGVGFVQMVSMASKTNPIIKHHFSSLNDYAQLRNAIVHSRVGVDEVIAEPHDRIVETIQSIDKQLMAPKKISEIVTMGDVFTCRSTDSIADVLEIQSKNNYSAVPVYDKNRYIGVLHARLYQRFLEVNRQETLDLKNIKVADILSVYRQDERVVFIDRDATVIDVIAKYDELNKKGRSMIVMILTEKGEVNKMPNGIITIADMAEIIRELE